MSPNRITRFAAAFLFSFIATTVSAATTTARYMVLFDSDDSASTGCTVTTPAASPAGIEHVMTTFVDTTDGVSRVTRVERQTCTGGTLSAPTLIDGTGWPVPTNSSGDSLIETRIPTAAFGTSMPKLMKLYFVVITGSGDVGTAITQRDGGSDILWPPGGRRRIVAPGDGTPMTPRAILADGDTNDWNGLVPFVSGAPIIGSGADGFFNVFLYPGDSNLFFQFVIRRSGGTGPNAVPDEYSVRQGRSINVTGPGVLANDSDPNGKPLTAVLETNAGSGTLVLKSDGGFSYTQNGSLVPTDEFKYRANNGSQTSDPAKVTLHVQPDQVPVAVNDAYSVAHGGTLTVNKITGVIANDHDADGDALTAIRFGNTNPQHGTLTFNADGSFTYVHDGSNTLSDFFQYRLNDGVLSGNVATVNITIGPDVAPVAVPDTYNVNEGATLNANVSTGVLSNDTDVDSPASMLTATLVTPTAHGSISLNPDGSFIYVQNGTDNAVDTFTYRIADNILTGNTVTVTINVTLLNDAPVAVNDSYTTLEDTPITVPGPGLLSNDTDEESNPLTAHIVTQAAHGIAAINPNGGFTYTPNANYNGPDSFTYAANDSQADSNTATVSVTVTAVNDVPAFTAGSGVTVLEDSGAYTAAWASAISAGPSDESGQALNFIVSNNNNALFSAQPAISAAGVLTFTPAANANGSATVSVQLHDNGGTANGGVDTTTTVNFTITVTAVNDVPVFVAGANQTSNEDAGAQTVNAWATGISAGPADEAGQALNFIVSNDNNSLFSVQPAVNAATGTLTYTAAANANGVANVSVQLHDNGGVANGGADTSAAQTFTITVSGVNDAPVNAVPGTQTTLEDTQVVFSTAGSNAITVSDVDANGGTEKVTLTAANGTITLGSTSGITITTGTGTGDTTVVFTGTIANLNVAMNGLSFLPSLNFNDNIGAATLTIQTDDQGNTGTGGALTDTDVISISVTPVNDAPSFTKGANQTVLEDSGLHTVNGWASSINKGAADESGQTLTFTVTNDNNALFSVQPAVDASGNLTYTLAANASGSATVTIHLSDDGGTANGGADTSADQTFAITVTDVNDVPSFTKGADATVLEDSGAFSQSGWATAISAGPAAESSQTVNFIVSNDNNSLFSVQPAVAANGTLTFTPAADASGTATVSVQIHDDGGTANGGVDTSAVQTFVVNVTAVNDVPSFTKGADQTVLEDSGAATVNGWATALSAGPSNESSQTLNFIVSNDNNSLFSAQPAVDASGNLTYTPAANAFGTATVSVQIHDNGGTTNGGVDTSSTQTFTITVTAVNDVPVFTKGADQTVLEDSGAATAAGWATGINAGPNEGSQTVNFIVTNDNNSLFSVQPAVAANGTLTFTPALNANGSATVSVQIHDDGGTSNGGVDTSAVQTFVINVTAVNDAPSFTKGADQTVFEDSGAATVNGWATALSAGPADESGQALNFTVSNDNNSLFSAQPAVDASGNLTYTPAANAFGTATVSVQIHDNGGTANGGADTSAVQTFTITVTGVNDAPSFTKGADQTTLEDSGPQTVNGWATAMSAGPSEGSQALNFIVNNDNNGLFSVQPAVDASGNLTYTPAADANGVATVSVQIHDDGGTSNGGVDTSAVQTFTISVTPVNDVPSFTKGADQTVLEDSGAATVNGWATSLSAGPADESGQALNFIVTNDNNSLFSVQPAVSASGNLTYTPAANAFGTATVSVSIHDNGGVANGGVDTSAVQTFTITVTGVNDAPSFTKGADQTVLEDSGAATVNGWATALSAGPNEGGQTLNFIVSNDNNPLFSVQPAVDASGNLTYTPAANANGSATVSVQIHDNGGTASGGVDTSAAQTFTITVTAVNDVPSFTKGADQTVLEDSGAATVNGWATALSAGPADESGQALNFIVSNDNNSLFSVQPAVSASGNLTYTPAANAFGTATVSVQIHDNGGVANGGVDTSAVQTFTITVNGVNDAPSFTKGADQSVLEDAAAQTVNGWATAISAGPNEGGQTVNFIASNDNNSLFSVQPAVSATGTLTYTLAANANGSATVSVSIHDDGGTASGGVDTSAAQTFTITVTAVNDVPSFTKGADITVNEDSGAFSQSGWATAISAGPADESGQALNFIVSNNNNSLFSVQPAVSATGALTFTPAANANGSATVTIAIHDNGGTANGGADTSSNQTFTITVNNVNDAPSFTKGANQTVLEDAAAQTVAGWATAISPGPADESGQTVSFVVTNDNNALFSVQPAVASNGTLTYTLAANANGIATVSIHAQDNGGTANGGVDISATQTFTITVTAVNDAPTFSITPPASPSPYFVLENSGANSLPNFISSISAGPTDESGQTVTLSITGNTNPGMFSVAPAISNTGTLTFTLASNTGDQQTTLTFQAQDTGGTANGGADLSTQTYVLKVEAAPKVISTNPTNASTVATNTPIVITFSEPVNATASSFTVSCGTFTLSASPSTSFTLTPTSTWTGGTCNVTVVAANITDTDSEDPPDNMAGDYNFSFTANTPPSGVNDAFNAIGNVSLSISAAQGLLANDSDADAGQTISATAGTFTTTGGGSITIAADGSFTYHTAAGASSGTDDYTYTVNDNAGGSATAKVTFTISGRYIYVQHDAAGGGDGRDFKPYQTVTAAEATAIAGDTIFVLTGGAGSMTDSFTLKNNQLLIGQGIATSITTTLNGNPVTLLASGSAGPITSAAAVTATLASGNTVRGLSITATNGTALSGTSFGTLTTDTLSLTSTNGPALSLTTGAIAGGSVMTSVSSTNSTTNGVLLNAVTGSLSISGGTVTGSTTAGVNVTGGTLSLSTAQNISASAGALVSVSGPHATGTLTFTGTLNATGGTGLQLTAANGIYSFPGTTTLNGGSAQVNIGGTGTFSFASGMTVTNPTAAAFQATGAPNVTYSGSLAQNTANAVVSISAQTGGTITFNTGTIASSATSTGVLLNNADGTVNFNSASTTLNGANGYAVSNGSSGTFNFANTHSITSSGTGFSVDTSNPTFTYPGSITANTAKAVSVNAVSGGSSTFSGSITSGTAGSQTGLGISVTNSTGGTIAFTGTSKSLFTSANNAVALTSNTGATINFTNGGLAITTTTGSAYTATGGGTVNVTGTGNTITTGAAAAVAPLNINATTVGGSGVTFASVNTTGATTGVSLTTIGAGTVTINGGTISGGTTGISMNTMSTGTLSLSGVTVSGGTTAISGTTFGTLSVATTTISGSGQIINLNTGTVNGTFTSISGAAAINGNINPVVLTSVGGTFTVSGGSITKGNLSNAVVTIAGGSAAITWQGSLTHSASGPVVSVTATHTGTLTFNTGTLTAGAGSTGLQFAGANGTYSFANLTCTTCANAVNIGTSTGTFTFLSTFTPQNSSGTLIAITGTQPLVDYQGVVSQNTGATAISISGVTGGTAPAATTPYTIRFSANITKSTTAGSAVVMSGNSGGVIGFTGPTLSFTTQTANAIDISGSTGTGPNVTFAPTTVLTISTTSGAGINVSNASLSGTLTITGAATNTNSITATSGSGLKVSNMNIGASGLKFQKISATGGTNTNGIYLNNTGSAGGLTVSGNGSAGTGGTISSSNGADAAGIIPTATENSGSGIFLYNTSSVSLAWMQINDHPNYGIYGNTVNGFSLTNSVINGANGSNSGVDEGSIGFDNLLGSATISNTTISGGVEDNIRLRNTSGTLNRLTIDTCTIGSNNATTGNAAINMANQPSSGTATMNVTIQNSTFTGSRSHFVQFLLNNTGTQISDFIFKNNTITNSMTSASGAGGVFISSASNNTLNPTFTYNIQGNIIHSGTTQILGTAIHVAHSGGAGSYNGTIDTNTIGTTGSANSGSAQANGIQITHVAGGTNTVHITGNTVRRYNNDGIYIQVGDNTSGGTTTGQNGTVNVTLTGNTVAEPDSIALHGVELNVGTTTNDAHFVCASIGGAGALKNTLTGAGLAANGGVDLRPRQRQNTTIRLPGYGGSATDMTAVQTFLNGQNTLTSDTASATSNGFVGGAACP